MTTIRFPLAACLFAAPLLALGLAGASGQAPKKTTPPPKNLVGADHAEKMARGLVLFKKQVRPLIEAKCLRCHGGKRIEGELDLSDREGLLRGGQSGPAIVPGKAKDSLLVKLVTHQRDPHMPRNGDRLPDAAIEQLRTWIDLGAPYDTPLVASKRKAPSWTERTISGEARTFWSFRPLARPALPAVKDEAWVRNPIDRFIRARQEAAGLTPNPSADRRTLARRVYFDLTGLPPTPAEVDAFENDPAPDAFDKLVEKLLASPHYGERWARHWLDLARFAESHGFEHDYDRPTAYHYRDFVIEALNRDLPYDTFVKWQIAGDEYAPENPLALKATGFLAAGVHSTQITKSEVAKHRYDEMDDKLNTLSTAFLGLTVGCARCHDHKYDPIPQRDYYRLLATFTTTVRSEIMLKLDPENYQQAKAAFERAHAPFVEALTRYEAEQLPARLAAWERAGAAAQLPWETVVVKSAKSKEGATLTPQSDGALLATGKNGKFDVYTIVTHTHLKGINAIRLEALAHPALVKGGPGRASNGNFALTDFKVTAAPLSDPKAKPMPVKLVAARATFEQKGLPVRAAIDTNPRSAWAIDPQFGKDHAAVFTTERPIGFDGGTVLTFTLAFQNNDGHNLGRPRLSIGTTAAADLTAAGVPAPVRHLLALPSAKRNAAQKKVVLDWYRTLDPGWRELDRKARTHQLKAPQPRTVKCLVATEGLPAVRLHTQGEDFLPVTHFLRRGDPDNKQGIATQGFLQVLTPGEGAEKQWQSAPPTGWRTSYRRRALAEWLTDTERGAGHLLARVIVNRLWQHHLGRGLVATPSDFGSRGERPTHPELLDYLAGELIKNGWRLKSIHKLIMTSATYRQSSGADEARTKLDRDNRLVWRNPSRRLEAEVIRDAILAVSGRLDPKLYGPGTLDPKSRRRSIYFTVKRSKLVPMMVIFDAPEALSGMAERPTTTIAPQALHLLNSAQVRAAASAFAGRLSDEMRASPARAVRAGYRVALGRAPTTAELADGVAFLEQQMATYPEPRRHEAALTDFCQVLLCLNEFVYVE